MALLLRASGCVVINSVMDGFNASRVGRPEHRSKPRLLNGAGRSQSPHLKALPAQRGGDFSTTDLSGTSRRGDWPAPKNQPRTLHSTSPLGSEVLRLKVCSPDRCPQSPRQFSGCTEEGRAGGPHAAWDGQRLKEGDATVPMFRPGPQPQAGPETHAFACGEEPFLSPHSHDPLLLSRLPDSAVFLRLISSEPQDSSNSL